LLKRYSYIVSSATHEWQNKYISELNKLYD
jgi:hypothetical protein